MLCRACRGTPRTRTRSHTLPLAAVSWREQGGRRDGLVYRAQVAGDQCPAEVLGIRDLRAVNRADR